MDLSVPNLPSSHADGADNLPKLAIEAALECRWKDSIKLNSQIIKVEPENVDALNRQGRCYFELGQIENAKKYYTLALKYDPYNPIAQKNLKIIQSFKKNATGLKNNNIGNGKISPSLFLQEPGKTKIVSLIKVAEPQKLSQAFCGMPVELVIKNRGISVIDMDGIYLGAFPDDIAHQLLRLIKGGNRYTTYVKGVKFNGMQVMIRELYRSSRFKNQPSFPEHVNYQASEIIPALNTSSSTQEEGENIEDEEET